MINGVPVVSKEERAFPCPCCGEETTSSRELARSCSQGCKWGPPGREPSQDFLIFWWSEDGTPAPDRKSYLLTCSKHGESPAFHETSSPAQAGYACPCCWLSTTPMEGSSRRECPGGCNFASWSGEEPCRFIQGLGNGWWQRWGKEQGKPSHRWRGKAFHCSTHGLVGPWTPKGMAEVIPPSQKETPMIPEPIKHFPCPCCGKATGPIAVLGRRRSCEDQCRFGGYTTTEGGARHERLEGWSEEGWWMTDGSPNLGRRGEGVLCCIHWRTSAFSYEGVSSPPSQTEASPSPKTPKSQICPRCATPATETRYPGNEPICTNERCDGKGFPLWFLKPNDLTVEEQRLFAAVRQMAGVDVRTDQRIRSIPTVTVDPGIVRMQQDLRLTRLTISTATLRDKPPQHPVCIHQRAGGIHECVCRKAAQCDLTIYCDSE